MIIRHIVIKMYYMLILYYEALERNVNLSQVYSVFKKQIEEAPERSGTREGSDGTRITTPCLHSSSFCASRCFIPLLPSFHPSSSSHRLVSPSRFQLKLHLVPSSHLFPSSPSCSFLLSVTPVMPQESHTPPQAAKRDTSASSLHHAYMMYSCKKVMWNREIHNSGKGIQED